MIGPLGRLGAAATLGQHCPQMTQRPGIHVYEFQVNYTCKDGYFFGSDYNQQAFTLTCFTNGTVGGADWAQCYHPSERFCFDPPAKPFNGGQVRLDFIALRAISVMTKTSLLSLERLE